MAHRAVTRALQAALRKLFLLEKHSGLFTSRSMLPTNTGCFARSRGLQQVPSRWIAEVLRDDALRVKYLGNVPKVAPVQKTRKQDYPARAMSAETVRKQLLETR